MEEVEELEEVEVLKVLEELEEVEVLEVLEEPEEPEEPEFERCTPRVYGDDPLPPRPFAISSAALCFFLIAIGVFFARFDLTIVVPDQPAATSLLSSPTGLTRTTKPFE